MPTLSTKGILVYGSTKQIIADTCKYHALFLAFLLQKFFKWRRESNKKAVFIHTV